MICIAALGTFRKALPSSKQHVTRHPRRIPEHEETGCNFSDAHTCEKIWSTNLSMPWQKPSSSLRPLTLKQVVPRDTIVLAPSMRNMDAATQTRGTCKRRWNM